MAKMQAESAIDMPDAAPGPGRPRCPQARTAILKAAQELLEEGGIGAFTIDGVAKRSGAAKTTIYRWWPNRGALVVDVFLQIAEKRSPFPETGSAVEDMKTQMRALARLFRGRLGRAAAAIMAEAQSDPETQKTFVERYMKPRRTAGAAVLARGIASGEVRGDFDPEAIADALYAPLYLRLLFKHQPLDDAAVDKIVDLVFEGLRPRKA